MMRMLKQGMVLLCILAVLCGCSGTADSGGEAKAQETSEREELVLWAGYELEGQKAAMDELVEAFNQSQEDYHLIWKALGPLSEFKRYLTDEIIKNDLPDLIIMDSVSMQRFFNNGIFLELNEDNLIVSRQEEYYQASLENVTHNGGYYAFPFSCYSKAVIYNRTYFEECGIDVPRNFNSFLSTIMLLSNANHYGLAVDALTDEESALQFLPWMLSASTQDGGIDKEGVLYAYQMIGRMAENGEISGECINWSETDVTRTFINGECAMMLGSPSVLSVLEEEQIQYGVFALPSMKKPVSLVMGDNLSIVKSGNIKGAQAFVEFFAEDEVMGNERQLQFGLPAKISLAEDMLAEHEEYVPFAVGLEYGTSIAVIEDWVKFSDAASDGVSGILTGQMSAEEAASLLDEYIGE